jgi:general secretion pathway protein H
VPAVTATTPTSAPGNSRPASTPRRRNRGFTLIELMIVVALIAVAAGVVSLALRDPARTRLDTEAQRLSALFEAARAESRASGVAVQWLPSGADEAEQFRFVAVDGKTLRPLPMPTRWLEPAVQAEVAGARAVMLGPEPLIGAQRVVLRLGEQRIDLSTDGLRPFGITTEGAGP